jgi:hypothetical protein
MQQETTCSHGPKRKPLPTNDEASIVYELTSGLRGCYCSDAVGCVGEGFYMDYYRNGVVAGLNLGQTYNEIDPILLRLSRKGGTYTFE